MAETSSCNAVLDTDFTLLSPTENSWGEDVVTGTQGIGLGPQEDFYNCADIRIGGPVPDSVKNNPFFAPPGTR